MISKVTCSVDGKTVALEKDSGATDTWTGHVSGVYGRQRVVATAIDEAGNVGTKEIIFDFGSKQTVCIDAVIVPDDFYAELCCTCGEVM